MIGVLQVLWVLQERKVQQGIRVFLEVLEISVLRVQQVLRGREEQQVFRGRKGEGVRGEQTALLENQALRVERERKAPRGRLELRVSSVKQEFQGKEDLQESLEQQVLQAALVIRGLQDHLGPEGLRGTRDQMESKVTRGLQDLKESRGLWVSLDSRVNRGLLENRVKRVSWASEVLRVHLEKMDIRGKTDPRVNQETVDQWESPVSGVRSENPALREYLEILGKKAFRDPKANRVCREPVDVQGRRVKRGRRVILEKWVLMVNWVKRVNEDSKGLEEPEDLQASREFWDPRENLERRVTLVTLENLVQQAPQDQKEKRVIQEKTVKRLDRPGP